MLTPNKKQNFLKEYGYSSKVNNPDMNKFISLRIGGYL